MLETSVACQGQVGLGIVALWVKPLFEMPASVLEYLNLNPTFASSPAFLLMYTLEEASDGSGVWVLVPG